MLWWILLVLALPVVAYVAMGVYLSAVLKWEDDESVGVRYYGRPRAERERFRRQLRRHARWLAPMLRLNARLATFDFRKVRMQYQGVSAPLGSCSMESFANAATYSPTPQDVFVVTQMKCGTTWMQQVAYEILCRGRGTLVDQGTALYAVAPWLEGRKSVAVDSAPLLGAERPSRLIKTHLPVGLCPFDPAARYIYVARHPVSCFASCIDFVTENAGGMAPGLEAFEAWFCSPELMWWGTWTDHVAGWWRRAHEHDNVLIVTFEEMKRDLPAVVRRVAAFLGMTPLSTAELADVVRKSGFEYMRAHQDSFEMHPPHLLQAGARLFVSGSAERHRDVPDDVRARVAAWAARELREKGVPVEALYPELATHT
jgi:hypothetical protein